MIAGGGFGSRPFLVENAMNPFAYMNAIFTAAFATAAYYQTHPLAYLLALLGWR